METTEAMRRATKDAGWKDHLVLPWEPLMGGYARMRCCNEGCGAETLRAPDGALIGDAHTTRCPYEYEDDEDDEEDQGDGA